jgi:hypothetical protein
MKIHKKKIDFVFRALLVFSCWIVFGCAEPPSKAKVFERSLSSSESLNTSKNVTSEKLGSAKLINPNNLKLCPAQDETKPDMFGSNGKTWKFDNCWGSFEKTYGRFDYQNDHCYIQYVGEFKNGEPEGFGVHYFKDGERYVGNFSESLFGQSSIKPALCEGIFKNGKRFLQKKNGDVYVGQFMYNEFHGEGLYVSVDNFRQEGIWERGRFSTSKKLDSIYGLLTSLPQDEFVKKFRESDTFTSQYRASALHLEVTHSSPNEQGEVSIVVRTGADITSLKINGEEQGGRADGHYVIKKFARIGQDTKFTISAVDINGNSDTQSFTVSRQAVSASSNTLSLKPEIVKRSPPRDAVAIIIGIQDYKRVPRAEFANNDAKEFYEYAVRALGIKQEKIKMLLDDEADEVNIVKAFENWLPIQVNKEKTDVYVFYSGHGLPAPDGKSLYFLPHGVDKELLSRTAVGQNEIVAALSAAKPKSVTMFIDACYSGQTRGGDVLVANAKPLSLKSDTNAYPTNFTVITASANDQISSSSPELKHGIFSFYLMKGMEGEADANKDGKITVGEMQDYLSDKVSRQAMMLNRKQTTQLVGDSGRILVGR